MVKVQFYTDNVAFKDGMFESECAKILRDIANKILTGDVSGKCIDENGNTCGTWAIIPD